MPRSLRLTKSRKLRLLGATAVLAAVVPSVGALAIDRNPPIDCGGYNHILTGGSGVWQKFVAPTFAPPVGLSVSQNVVAYATDPTNPQAVIITNGNSIYYSGTSGCAWQLGLRLDQTPNVQEGIPLSGQFTRIVSLYIAPKSHRMYALAEELETGASVGRPHVLTSTDGTTWTLGDEGLPPLGHPLRMRAAPTNPNVLYLSFQNARDTSETCPPPPVPCSGTGDGRPLGLLWASTDAGKSWTSRTDPSDLNGSYPIKFFSIDDDDATGNTVWVVANGLLRLSTNGGRSFVQPDGLDQSNFHFTAVESIDKGKYTGTLRLVAFSGEGEMLRLDKNKWIRSKVPFFPVESVAQRADGDIAVATTSANGYVTIWRIFARDFIDFEEQSGVAGQTFRTTQGWESITPGVVIDVPAAISAGVGGVSKSGTYFVKDKRDVYRFLGSKRRDHYMPSPPAQIGAPPPPRGHFTPSTLVLNLPLGKTQTVDYTLTMPPAPTPIDLFLLIDNSGSMISLIDDLKENMGDVARSLVAGGVDVWVGIGQVNVQPTSLPIDNPDTQDKDESKPWPLYELLHRLGPVTPSFFADFSRMHPGDGGQGDEAQLESLWQSVVGDGLDPNGIANYVTGYTIPAHQQAGFRSGVSSIKVIVHATDEGFSTNIKTTGAHNSFGPVAAQLRTAGIKQIGLSQDNTDATRDLSEMARLTNTLAPRGGVDCSGDGIMDIPAGDPLVCPQNEGLDKTLVNLLRSLNDVQRLDIDPHPSITMRKITTSGWTINAKDVTKKTFRVTYSCVGVPAGTYENSLDAVLRGMQVATAVATVNCGAPGIPQKPDVFDEVPPPAQPLPAPPPALAPVQPIPQPQAQVQANPQFGAASQEEEQHQLATADNDITEPSLDQDELAMSALDPRPRWASPPVALGVGLAMSAACGVALRRRTRTQVARVKIR